MSTRHSSAMSSKKTVLATTSSLAKRPALAENVAKSAAAAAAHAQKRVALGNITNAGNVGRNLGAKGVNKPSGNSASFGKIEKKGPVVSARDARLQPRSEVNSARVDLSTNCLGNGSLLPAKNVPVVNVLPTVDQCSDSMSPSCSGDSVSMGETMSTCDSMKSPVFEYIDNGDCSVVESLKRRNDDLCVDEHEDAAGSRWKEDASPMEIDGIVDVDTKHDDPQFCTTLACDIYRHLRIAETKKRPSKDFMETIQKDINPSMRSILIDWLVEVAEEYRLVPDTLFLTVNYIDRYLSGNELTRQQLQLLGVACMLIASKYEEICAPQVEEFCYITDNTYFRDEVLQMEADVLKFLKFEMTAPTAKCFLRRFVRAAHVCYEAPHMQFEFLSNYIAELSLLEYNMLCYSPSLIAASAVFLAKFILQPTKKPWSTTLSHYTLYKPSDLSEPVKALHRLICRSSSGSLPAIREKYSQHKYKFVAKKCCPASIPSEFFDDSMN